MKAIFLTGFMGCGKSTVGKLLAEHLGWEFVDLDERIEALAGKPIARIFSENGEDEFRRLEHETLVEQARLARDGNPRAAALGGGAFTFERNRRAISAAGVSIWLDAPVETLWERVRGEQHRPLASDPEKFRALYAARRNSYAQADRRADATAAPEHIVNEILRDIESVPR